MKSLGPQIKVAVVGTGPAGLMAADVLCSAGLQVFLFDKKSGPGRKLLIAGSSGLNVTFNASPQKFAEYYGEFSHHMASALELFSPLSWLKFINELGIETFLGTSGRYFVKGLKASNLLRTWMRRLHDKKVETFFKTEVVDFSLNKAGHVQICLRKENENQELNFDAVVFALGGGSYEEKEKPLRWPNIFSKKFLSFEEFTASNVGFEVAWPENFLKEANGLPLKNIVVHSPKGSKQGDLMITGYGLEGTPIYFVGQSGEIFLDLKPDLDEPAILSRIEKSKKNLSPIRQAKKNLNLSPAALALIFHLTPPAEMTNASVLAGRIKCFPVTLGSPRSLEEAISSKGGLSFEELTSDLMVKKFPGIFVAGEMLNWDAPTGGFLIQGCVSQGYSAAQGVLRFLNSKRP